MREPIEPAERIVIGMSLTDRRVFEQAIAAGINEACFTGEPATLVWAAMVALDRAGVNPDMVTVRGKLATYDATMWLVTVVEEAPVAINPQMYIAALLNARWARNVHRVLAEIAPKVSVQFDPFQDVEPLRALVGQVLEAVMSGPKQAEERFTEELVPRVLDSVDKRIEDRRDGKRRGITTGLKNLDLLLGGGLRPGAMYCVAARPGQGKTTFAVSAAMAAAAEKATVGFYSVEQLDEELTQKLISNAARVLGTRLDSGNLDEAELDQVIAGAKETIRRRIYMAEGFNASTERLVASMRRMRRRGQLDVAVVDYIQRLTLAGEKHENRQAAIANISRQLKQLAMELHIPILVLAQLNREAAKLPGSADIQHIKDSGAIEQDADVVVVINVEGEQSFLDVRKNRHGHTGRLLVKRELAVNLFSDEHIAAPYGVEDV